MLLTFVVCSTATAAAPVSRAAEKSWEGLASTLAELADRYETLDRVADAERLRQLSRAGLAATSDPPPQLALDAATAHLPPAILDVWVAEREACREHAEAVYRVARAALNDGRTSEARHWLFHILAVDSDFERARDTLGYVRVDNRWETAFRKRMHDAGRVWRDRFGWLPVDHVARYEAGERYFRNRWMSAEEEAAFRQHFEYAWTVESEHFEIKTNVSLETAATLAIRLEAFHEYFLREFAPLFNSRRIAREMLKPTSRRQLKKHEVQFFSSREEYVRRLTPKQQGVAISRGVYLPRDRVSYFFLADDDSDPLETLYHEVTHQILFESDPRPREVADSGGYWAVEGLACYLESFEDPAVSPETTTMTAGDVDHDRMYWARHRVLVEGYYLPLQQFDRLGMKLFQSAGTEDELRRRYSQSTGMTHFFLHYDGGRYRDGFLSYLASLYAPTFGASRSLDRRLGVPAQLLDQQYRDHLATIERTADLPTVRSE